MTIVLVGANGQLGSDLRRVLNADYQAGQIVPLTRSDLDVTDHGRVREFLAERAPRVVINTAAYHRVDEVESNPFWAFEVNAIAVHNLASVCRDLDCVLVHVSTDYVFGGADRTTPYAEADPPFPVNVYGSSKLAGEYLVRSTCPRHFVVRSSGLYGVAGSSGKGGNFVERMLCLASEGQDIRVVDDQRLAPTYTVDLARKIVALLQTDRYGLYHVVNAGSCTWYEFAREIFRLLGAEARLSPTTSAAFGAKARRPRYSVLQNRALRAQGQDDLRPWPEALRAYLSERRPREG